MQEIAYNPVTFSANQAQSSSTQRKQQISSRNRNMMPGQRDQTSSSYNGQFIGPNDPNYRGENASIGRSLSRQRLNTDQYSQQQQEFRQIRPKKREKQEPSFNPLSFAEKESETKVTYKDQEQGGYDSGSGSSYYARGKTNVGKREQQQSSPNFNPLSFSDQEDPTKSSYDYKMKTPTATATQGRRVSSSEYRQKAPQPAMSSLAFSSSKRKSRDNDEYKMTNPAVGNRSNRSIKTRRVTSNEYKRKAPQPEMSSLAFSSSRRSSNNSQQNQGWPPQNQPRNRSKQQSPVFNPMVNSNSKKSIFGNHNDDRERPSQQQSHRRSSREPAANTQPNFNPMSFSSSKRSMFEEDYIEGQKMKDTAPNMEHYERTSRNSVQQQNPGYNSLAFSKERRMNYDD